jgi:hypothetical protein
MKSWTRTVGVSVTASALVLSGVGIASATRGDSARPGRAPAPATHRAGVKPNVILPDTTGDEAVLVPTAPCRLAFTKGHGGKVSTTPRSFAVGGTVGFPTQGGTSGGCGIPIGATAIEATLITSKQAGNGNLKAWAAGSPTPGPSVLSFGKNTTLDNSVTVDINPNAAIALSLEASKPTQVGIIVTGYYQVQIAADILGSGGFFGHTSRVVSVSHTAATGIYSVTVSRATEGSCTAQATPVDFGDFASAITESAGVITVRTWHLVSGVPTALDEEFNLTVIC